MLKQKTAIHSRGADSKYCLVIVLFIDPVDGVCVCVCVFREGTLNAAARFAFFFLLLYAEALVMCPIQTFDIKFAKHRHGLLKRLFRVGDGFDEAKLMTYKKVNRHHHHHHHHHRHYHSLPRAISMRV